MLGRLITPPEDELQYQLRKFVNKFPCPEEAFYFQVFYSGFYSIIRNVKQCLNFKNYMMCFHRSVRKSGFARRLNLANMFFLCFDVTIVKHPVNRLPVVWRSQVSRWGVFICMYVWTDREEIKCPRRPYWKYNKEKHLWVNIWISKLFEFSLLFYRCDWEWQTVPVINNPARKTVSSLAGSPGLMKQSNSWSY